MSLRRLAPESEQPKQFTFTEENRKKAQAIIARYPAGKQASAVLPLLDLAQRQHDNWIPQKAIEVIAEMLGMARIRVYEVATFYSMFNLAPVGKFYIQLCGTTPCWLRGSDEIKAAIREELGIGMGESTPDGLFSTIEVECLGACVNAPMVQINDDYYEDLNKERMKALLRAMKHGETPKPGPQSGRTSSEPADGPTTLTSTGAE